MHLITMSKDWACAVLELRNVIMRTLLMGCMPENQRNGRVYKNHQKQQVKAQERLTIALRTLVIQFGYDALRRTLPGFHSFSHVEKQLCEEHLQVACYSQWKQELIPVIL